MRPRAPFQADDLDELDRCFYARAARVVAMEDVVDGDRAPNVIGLRHDCDANHSLRTAVAMAHWEQEHGYRSTYFVLHTSPYWTYTWFPEALDEIAGCGHEIGIHTNALAESLRTGQDPDVILDTAITRLRSLGHDIRGAVGHGDKSCLRHREDHESKFANDEQFKECRRSPFGPADRILARGENTVRLTPRPLADFGLDYEALWCAHPWTWRVSDSNGMWINPGFEETAERFAKQTRVTALPRATDDPRQLHVLTHPDWWAEALPDSLRVAA